MLLRVALRGGSVGASLHQLLGRGLPLGLAWVEQRLLQLLPDCHLLGGGWHGTAACVGPALLQVTQ